MKVLITIILTILGISLYGQSLDDNFQKEDIKIQTSLKYNKSNAFLTTVYLFNNDGQIKYIDKGTLNPVGSKKNIIYCAKYEYSTNGNISKEFVFENLNSEFKLLRTTKYIYKKDSLVLTVKSQNDNKLIAEIIEFKERNKKTRINKLDNVIGLGKVYNGSTFEYYYEKNRLNKINRSVNNITTNMQFQYQKDKSIISVVVENDTSQFKYSEHRFYNKEGRLTNISSNNKKREWHTKFNYNKNGMLTKIIRRGRLNTTNQKMTSSILFDIIHFDENIKGKKREMLIKKISDELINMYYPISGQMNYFNYLDSRRFISHHG